MTDYHKVNRIPVILHNGTWSSYHYKDGLLSDRVTEKEAEAFLVHHFHIEVKDD